MSLQAVLVIGATLDGGCPACSRADRKPESSGRRCGRLKTHRPAPGGAKQEAVQLRGGWGGKEAPGTRHGFARINFPTSIATNLATASRSDRIPARSSSDTVAPIQQSQAESIQQRYRRQNDRIRQDKVDVRHPEKTVAKGVDHIQYRVDEREIAPEVR